MQPELLLNRHGELRHFDHKITEFFDLTGSKILLCCKGRFFGNGNEPSYLSASQLSTNFTQTSADVPIALDERIYLGKMESTHYFLVINNTITAKSNEFSPLDLRSAAMNLSKLDSSILFYAQGLVNWHFNHPFCAKCGTKTIMQQAGHSRLCVNESCKKEHFPRIEPAIITSIETTIDDINHILLARQANWPEKRYSVIAGFAEHGETLEATVQREALEEVGLMVDNIQYIASQAWPFPASLMIAFSCETKQSAIRLLDNELEQAEWFSAESLKTAIQNGVVLMPYSASVSWDLIDRWFQKQTNSTLQSINRK